MLAYRVVWNLVSGLLAQAQRRREQAAASATRRDPTIKKPLITAQAVTAVAATLLPHRPKQR
jgi:hypothetical protein